MTTPIIENSKILTPRRHHELHTLSNDLSSTNTSNHKNKSFGGIESSSINIVGDNLSGFGGNSSESAIAAANASSSACQINTNHFAHHNKHSHNRRHPSHSDDSAFLLRHRWQGCPELHKAMDGVNYIADHTKKEEESTKVMLEKILYQTKIYNKSIFLFNYMLCGITDEIDK